MHVQPLTFGQQLQVMAAMDHFVHLVRQLVAAGDHQLIDTLKELEELQELVDQTVGLQLSDPH